MGRSRVRARWRHYPPEHMASRLSAVSRCVLGGAMLTAAACAHGRAPIVEDPALTIELIAVRSVLGPYRFGVVIVEPTFAHPDQAPPAMTQQVRPAIRQRALADSLQLSVSPGRRDTFHVRASEPRIRGREATISVTVSRDARRGRRDRFYETVAFVLEHTGSRWIVRERTQLGIT